MSSRHGLLSIAAVLGAVAMVLAGAYLSAMGIGVWTLPADDWGVGDQGHDVMAFMAALAASLAVLLGLGALRLVEFALGRRGPDRWSRANAVAVALVASIWTVSTVAEGVQQVWAHTNGGVDIEVAGPFLAIAFVAFFRALTLRRPARREPGRFFGAIGLGVAAAASSTVALPLIHHGIDLMVTPFCGHNDNATSVYLVFGGTIALAGAVPLWVSAFLAGLANEVYAGPLPEGGVRRLLRQAAGLTFALLSPLCLIMALAISTADPEHSSSGPLFAPYILGAIALGLLFAAASFLMFCPRARPGGSGALRAL